MSQISKRKYLIFKGIIKCGFAVCIAAFLMMAAPLKASAEQIQGSASAQEISEISTIDIVNRDIDMKSSSGAGNTGESSSGAGNTEESSSGAGSTEEGTTEEGSTEEGTTEEGSTEEGTTEEGSTEEGTTEEGSTELPELIVQPLEVMAIIEVLSTKTALETECEALGLLCNGTAIIGYDAGKIGAVLEIPEGVTTISGLSGMPAAEVILPASLMEIGGSCFFGCPNLKKVSFRSGSQLYAIFMSAFYGCSELETVDFSNVDFTAGPNGDVVFSVPFGGCSKLKRVIFNQTAIEKLKSANAKPFGNFDKFAQFTLEADGTVASEADLCTFWKTGIEDMVDLGLRLNNVSKAAVIFNGSEIDITKRLQTLNIAEAYALDNLDSQEQDLIWTSCFSESTAKTASGLLTVSTGGSSADGLHFASFAEFYKNVLKEGNINDLRTDLQNQMASVFSNVVTALVVKTQTIPKTVQDLSIDRVTVLKT